MFAPKMLQRILLTCVPALCFSTMAAPAAESPSLKPQTTEVAPGIWRLRFGEPEAFTPERFRHRPPMTAALAELPHGETPFQSDSVTCRLQSGRCIVHVPLEKGSQIFGFGLEPNAVSQRGLMKTLQVCAAPVGRAGYSHGPVPFYVSPKGYPGTPPTPPELWRAPARGRANATTSSLGQSLRHEHELQDSHQSS